MFRMVAFFVMAVALAGCGKDPYASYVGLWQRQGVDFPQVMQISKDGETYLVNDNILQAKDFFGNDKKPNVLTKSEGQLMGNNGLASFPLGLSEDQNTLHVEGQEYKRIAPDQLDKIKAKIESDRVAAEKNRELCKSLNNDYSEKIKKLQENKNFSERMNQQRDLGQEFQAKAKEIPLCMLTGGGWY